jgi:folate-binding protein YgfZ
MEPHQHTSSNDQQRPAARRWFRRTDRGRLRFSGRDALSFLQALVTNDVDALPIGGAIDAAWLTPQGRMITDLRIFRRTDDVIVSVPIQLTAALAARFDSLLFSEDVQIADVTSEVPQVTVIALGGQSPNLQEDLLYEPPPGGPELSSQEYEAMRIEAGIAKWGIDMTEDTIPLEAGLLARAISQNKGCYVGQEVIIRVLHRGGGRVAKRLMRIVFEPGATFPSGEPVPGPGASIDVDGVSVGAVTSAALSAVSGRVVALGYVKRDHAEAGTAVLIGGQPAMLRAAAS